MSGASSPGASSPGASLTVGGRVFRRWTSLRITRDLKDICGAFELELYDAAREEAAGNAAAPVPEAELIAPGLACTLALDGEVVLKGWIDEVASAWQADSRTVRVSGRDKCGDLVDCSPFPDGPAELRNIGLFDLAKRVCEPFGITVRAETDLGEPFPLIACYPHESALSLLEKQARQRAVLVVSDGVGGLVFTRAGTSRAAAPLRIGELIQQASLNNSWRARFSRIVVKGQSDQSWQGGSAPLGHASGPATTPPASPGAGAAQAPHIVMQGSATDPEITRFRPSVRMARTQSGASTLQVQAEWAVRVARGQGFRYEATVLGWRAGDDHALWRPNTLAAVWDPFAPLDEEMIIARVVYEASGSGRTTRLSLEGKSAFDRIDEPYRRRHRRPWRLRRGRVHDDARGGDDGGRDE